MATYDQCIHCFGSGEDPANLEPCPFCDGYGVVREDRDVGDEEYDGEEDDESWT